MKKSKWLTSILVLCIAALALSACGSSSPSVDVSLTSFKISPSPTSIAAGNITFHIKNDATDVAHDMIIVKTDAAAGSLPTDSTGAVDQTKVTVVGQIQPLQPGASTDLTVNLAAGHYVLYCSVVGHYASGMDTDFTVN